MGNDDRTGVTPSEYMAFVEALLGGKGEFDAWLECHDEYDCREFIKYHARHKRNVALNTAIASIEELTGEE